MTGNKIKNLNVNIQLLYPAQIRYSSKNVQDKIREILSKSSMFYGDKNFLEFKHAIPAILRSDGTFVVCDNHHTFMAIKALGRTKVAVKTIDVYQGNNERFWEWAIAHDYAYLETIDGQKVLPPLSWEELIDDPIRYFITKSARKFEQDLTIKHSIGYEYPLWVKIKQGQRNFIEFIMANYLYAHGFSCTYEDIEDAEIFKTLVAQARSIFIKHPIEGSDILKTHSHYTKSYEIKKLLRILKNNKM